MRMQLGSARCLAIRITALTHELADDGVGIAVGPRTRVEASNLGCDRFVRVAQQRPALGGRGGARPAGQHSREVRLDRGDRRVDPARPVDTQHRRLVLACLPLDRLDEQSIERCGTGRQRPVAHDVLVELPCGQQPYGLRPLRHPRGDGPCRQRRSLGDDERRTRKGLEVVDDHRAAFAV